ncbi:hypothetical protein IW261DRAFT_1566123 [Armillaria novae-zelandiae]|uniref:Uncharacterized protein n=1 Tax=Armillaria novae-zelandiae TaxID=153914 RepID=A0AA39P450_9AGAR|nr:hypothetical protein IW261DRAFT_1566123 [Armillaria novae-zelandiae]
MTSTLRILQRFPDPLSQPLPPLPLHMPTSTPLSSIPTNKAPNVVVDILPSHLPSVGLPSFPPSHVGSQDHSFLALSDFAQLGPPPPIATSEMLRCLRTEETPPPHVCIYFHNVIRHNLQCALYYASIAEKNELDTISSTATVADIYSIMAGLGSGLSFLFALGKNLREREVRRLKQIEGLRKIVKENMENSFALLK